LSTPEPEETQGSPLAAPEAEQPAPRRRRGRWLILLVLVLAAAVGVVFGAGIALRSRSFGTPVASDAAARPTFVITALASPGANPSESPRPATALPGAADEYVVEPGDTLRSIAERLYGDSAQWSRIYEANRAAIGPDPDTITSGTRLRIPRP